MIPLAVVYGMPKVKRVTMSKDMEKNSKKYKFELFVEGNVFKSILQLDEVDCSKTCTVDIHETFQVLGIEAARR
jgi:DNA-directed RNA polymerase beta' subunit